MFYGFSRFPQLESFLSTLTTLYIYILDFPNIQQLPIFQVFKNVGAINCRSNTRYAERGEKHLSPNSIFFPPPTPPSLFHFSLSRRRVPTTYLVSGHTVPDGRVRHGKQTRPSEGEGSKAFACSRATSDEDTQA
jgi:hypothetical protein